MKRIVLGILAHVDSGKTTLSESILYNTGAISRLGRVDHGDAFLDTDTIERDRGITIYSKQAVFSLNDTSVTLIDTPGHADFSAEAERTLCALDYAVLVISATDGVQSHTRTLWNMLSHYNIPTLIFVNKMDIAHKSREEILSDISLNLSEFALDFSNKDDTFYETASLSSDFLMDEYLNDSKISDKTLSEAVKTRSVFPCFFGSALKNDSVDVLLNAIDAYSLSSKYPSEFGARVIKITEDARGTRLTHLKITGGNLNVKTNLQIGDNTEKVNEIRIYSGDKYTSVQSVEAGQVCAVTGITALVSGDGVGIDEVRNKLLSEPLFNYCVKLPDNTDISQALSIFKKLESEDSQLKVSLVGNPQKINVRIMGEIQLEVLKRVLSDRFSLNAEFEKGSIVYKETIANTVEGVGHYEPLRHYSEVHLLIEPMPRGSGLTFQSKCSEDVLERNWQRLVMTHLAEKKHLGTLTGSEFTDAKITLVSGRADKKHTDGGDFRQATYRAVRQGLMQGDMILLEPYYFFSLEIPTASTGRAMTDLQKMGADFTPPDVYGDITRINGKAPVSQIMDYHSEVIAYTKGLGRLNLTFSGYDRCLNQEDVVSSLMYDPTADLENTPDSVFCSHGAGFTVKWDEVFEHMHLPLMKTETQKIDETKTVRQKESVSYTDDELLEIFEKTYGKVKNERRKTHTEERSAKPYKSSSLKTGPEYFLIDGYNVIHGCEPLKKIFLESPDTARRVLITRLCNYQAMRENNVILVFDAYKVKGNLGEVEKVNNITVVYTKEAETADTYIEKASKELSKNYRVRVATSDSLEQLIIFGNGAIRVTSEEFYRELTQAEEEMRRFISSNA